MKRLLPFAAVLALMGQGCGAPATPSAPPSAPSQPPAAEKPAGTETLEASFDRSVSPRPACDDIQGIKNSMNAGTWVADDDRGISGIFPALPSDTELCGYYNTTKIVMYSTSLSPNEGIAYYEEKLKEMGFTVERKNSIFKGVGYLNARKSGVATVNITFDGNQGFMSFNFVDQR